MGIKRYGVKTDFKNWAIMSNIWFWYKKEKSKKIYNNGKKYIWIRYKTIIEDIPTLEITSKNALSKRFNELEEKGLIERFQTKNNTLYIHITELSELIYYYGKAIDKINEKKSNRDEYPENQIHKDSTKKKHCTSTVVQHNKKTNNNIKSFKDNNDSVSRNEIDLTSRKRKKLSTIVKKNNSTMGYPDIVSNNYCQVDIVEMINLKKTVKPIEKLPPGSYFNPKNTDKANADLSYIRNRNLRDFPEVYNPIDIDLGNGNKESKK